MCFHLRTEAIYDSFEKYPYIHVIATVSLTLLVVRMVYIGSFAGPCQKTAQVGSFTNSLSYRHPADRKTIQSPANVGRLSMQSIFTDKYLSTISCWKENNLQNCQDRQFCENVWETDLYVSSLGPFLAVSVLYCDSMTEGFDKLSVMGERSCYWSERHGYQNQYTFRKFRKFCVVMLHRRARVHKVWSIDNLSLNDTKICLNRDKKKSIHSLSNIIGFHPSFALLFKFTKFKCISNLLSISWYHRDQ